MKGITDEPQYSVGLLEGGMALCDVIDNHIYEQTLVRDLIAATSSFNINVKVFFLVLNNLKESGLCYCNVMFIARFKVTITFRNPYAKA